MKPQGWITGWLKPWDQILHGCKIIAAKNKRCVFTGLMSVLSVSSVVNPFTNEFSPGSPGEVGLNT
jgi:hypothetical protein